MLCRPSLTALEAISSVRQPQSAHRSFQMQAARIGRPPPGVCRNAATDWGRPEQCTLQGGRPTCAHGIRQRLPAGIAGTTSPVRIDSPGIGYWLSSLIRAPLDRRDAERAPVRRLAVNGNRPATRNAPGLRLPAESLLRRARPPAPGIALGPVGRFVVAGTLAEGRIALSAGCASRNGLLWAAVDVRRGARASARVSLDPAPVHFAVRVWPFVNGPVREAEDPVAVLPVVHVRPFDYVA